MNQELWDEVITLRGLARRQAREMIALQDTVANLTASVAAINERLAPRSSWVYEEGQPPEWLPDDDGEPPFGEVLAPIGCTRRGVAIPAAVPHGA